MTAPKTHLPGQFVELERGTTQRQYLLRPGKDTRELVGYLYGKALLDHGQQACVACCLSTHYHSAQLDVTGRRSDFMKQFHSNTTRKRNLQVDRRENLWAATDPGDMALLELDDIIRKVVYVCTQPVAANCVERVGDWTGFQILPEHWGKPMRFPRPALCGPDMPEWVEFTPMPPPGFEHLPLPEVIAFFEGLIIKEEKRLARKRRVPVLGIDYCEAVSPFKTPRRSRGMRKLNPKFACRNTAKLVLALRRQRAFRQEHRDALLRFRSGNRSVTFPAGTIQMVQLAGAGCATANAQDPRMTCLDWSAAVQAAWDDRLNLPRRAD